MLGQEAVYTVKGGALLLCALLSSGCAKCLRSHSATVYVPRACTFETLGSPGIPYPFGDGIGGVKVPIESCREAYSYITEVCDEWAKK